ncbi:MAG: hypothetical protein ACLUCU_08740 [Slackia sp.]
MSDIDERVREAYWTLHVPDGLKAATLARIEEERRACASPAQRDVCPPESASSDASGNGGLAAQGAARRMSDAHGGRNASSHATGDKGFFAARRPRRAAGPRRRMMVAAAAACAILAAVGVGGYAYAMAPVAHVGIDVNPSFELSLNRFDRVVQARAVDEEAAEVLERIDIDGVRYEDAMETLASACRAYTGEEASVEVGVACDDEKRCEAIESAVLRCFEGDAGQVHCGRISDAQGRRPKRPAWGRGATGSTRRLSRRAFPCRSARPARCRWRSCVRSPKRRASIRTILPVRGMGRCVLRKAGATGIIREKAQVKGRVTVRVKVRGGAAARDKARIGTREISRLRMRLRKEKRSKARVIFRRMSRALRVFGLPYNSVQRERREL